MAIRAGDQVGVGLLVVLQRPGRPGDVWEGAGADGAQGLGDPCFVRPGGRSRTVDHVGHGPGQASASALPARPLEAVGDECDGVVDVGCVGRRRAVETRREGVVEAAGCVGYERRALQAFGLMTDPLREERIHRRIGEKQPHRLSARPYPAGDAGCGVHAGGHCEEGVGAARQGFVDVGVARLLLLVVAHDGCRCEPELGSDEPEPVVERGAVEIARAQQGHLVRPAVRGKRQHRAHLGDVGLDRAPEQAVGREGTEEVGRRGARRDDDLPCLGQGRRGSEGALGGVGADDGDDRAVCREAPRRRGEIGLAQVGVDELELLAADAAGPVHSVPGPRQRQVVVFGPLTREREEHTDASRPTTAGLARSHAARRRNQGQGNAKSHCGARTQPQ